MKIAKIFLWILMVTALVGGVILVRQNQETRRGAAANETTISVLPDSLSLTKDATFEVGVWINTGSEADKMTGGEFRVDFDRTKLQFESATIEQPYMLVNDGLEGRVGPNSGSGPIEIKAVSQGSFKSGAFNLVKINFKVLTDSGNGKLTPSGRLLVEGQQAYWIVSNNIVANYTIGTVVEPTAEVTAEPTAGAVTNTPVPTVTGTPECEGAIKKCVGGVPTWCLSGKWQAMSVCGTGKVCDAGVCIDLTVEPTVKPTLALTPTVDDNALYLNFKTTIQGVAVESLCASSWRASVILKSGVGTTMVYRNVPLVRSDIVSGIPTYNGTVKLEGWTEKTNLLVFIKGEKHMQMKYGQDNQVTAFPETVGKLTVSEGTSSPIYNFTGYPLMPGDVNQDGMINGDDFSLIKTKTQTYETVAEGDADAIYDLDGNCQLNTIDIAWLSKSLNTRQDEIY